jgi:hypothetical protein
MSRDFVLPPGPPPDEPPLVFVGVDGQPCMGCGHDLGEHMGTRLICPSSPRGPCFDAVPRSCRDCGCTDEQACPGACFWVLPDVCSACATRQLREAGLTQEALAIEIGLGGAQRRVARKLTEVAANAAGRASLNEIDVGGWVLISTTAVPDAPARLQAIRAGRVEFGHATFRDDGIEFVADGEDLGGA